LSDHDADLRQALELAVYREIGARNFYGRIAGIIRNPEGKNRFRQLSEDEDGHRKKLASWFEKLFGEAFVEKADRVEESEIPGMALDERTSAIEALDIAIKAEAKANEFYTKQAELAGDPGLAQLFSELAEEERGHYTLLEAERNSLIGGFYWFDMDSTSFLED